MSTSTPPAPPDPNSPEALGVRPAPGAEEIRKEPGGALGALASAAKKPVATVVTGVLHLAGWVVGKTRR